MAFGDEIVLILILIGHSLQSAVLVVDALEWSAGDWVVVPVEDSTAMVRQSSRLSDDIRMDSALKHQRLQS